jgi:hypothetical protein
VGTPAMGEELIILLIYTNLLPIKSSGQINLEMVDKNMNNIFDNAIQNDTNYLIQKTNSFPKSITLYYDVKINNSELTYDSKQNYYDLKKLLDNENYSENQKIKFINEALNDTTKDALEYINTTTSNFWKESAKGKEIVEKYFERKQFETSIYSYIKYKYFIFKLLNDYPESENLIDEYFANREIISVKSDQEDFFISVLLKLGKEEKAVKYLKILIEDFCQNKTKHEIVSREIFDSLCLSENKIIANEATNLFFQYLDEENVNTDDYYILSTYLDKEKHTKVLEKWFEYYIKLDFDKINLESFNLYDAGKIQPEFDAYISFMVSNSLYLGEKIGKRLWKEFLIKLPIWKKYFGQSFQIKQMYIIENSFKDKKLSIDEKRTMLFQAIKGKIPFNESDYYGYYKSRFLNLIIKAYPDLKINKEDFYKLELDKFIEYTFPLIIDNVLLEVHSFSKNLEGLEIDTIINDLNQFAKINSLQSIILSNTERFKLSLKSAKICIFDFFNKNEKVVGFYAQGSDSPANYIDLYRRKFETVLSKSGMQIEISQITTRLKENEYHYQIFIKNNSKSIYLHEYSGYDTDWYSPNRMVKMINLCLIENDLSDRLVEIYTGDPVYMFILMNPKILKPLLYKYGIDC